METNGEVDIGDLSGKFQPKICSYMYNCYIPNQGMKSNIVLSPSEITQSKVSLNSVTSSNSNEDYTLLMGNKVLYDLNMINTMTVKINATGVVTHQDQKLCMTGQFKAATALVPPTSLLVGYSRQLNEAFSFNAVSGSDDQLGCANPCAPGIFGFCEDPINNKFSNLTVSMGQGQFPIPTNLPQDMVGVFNRFLDYEEMENYDGLRKHDQVENYEDITTKYHVPTEKFTNLYSVYGTGDPTLAVNYAGHRVNVETLQGTTLREINEHPMNALGALNRGKIFYDQNRTTYKFTKGIPSPNYEFDTNTSGYKLANNGVVTVDLYTYWINGIPYPSNVRNPEDVNISKSNYDAIFYTNKKNSKILFTVMKSAGFMPQVTTAVDEPDMQTLNIEIIIKDISGPLIHPIFHNRTGKASLCNLSNMNIKGEYRKLEETLLKYSHYVITDIAGQWHDNVNNVIALPTKYIDQSLKGKITVSITESALHYKMYHVPPTLQLMQNQVTLPYYLFHNDRTKITTPMRQWQNNARVQKETPRYVLISACKYDDVSPFRADGVYHRIKSVGLSINDNPDVMITRTATDLYNLTKLNGLIQYDEGNYKGKVVFVPDVKTNATNNMPKLNMLQSQSRKTQLFEIGSILLLKFGEDIPLGAGGNVAGSNDNLKLQYTINFYDDTEKTGALNIMHISEMELLLENNVVNQFIALIKPSEVSKAIEVFQARARSNVFYMKANSVRGGNFFRGAMRHIKSISAKILPVLQNAASNFYSNNKDSIHQIGRNAASNLLDSAANSASQSGHRNLASILQQGRQQL